MVRHQQRLKEQAQRREDIVQNLQQQLQAVGPQLGLLQQQAQVQSTKAYKAAVAASVNRLQELQDRYFHSTPVDTFSTGKQSGSSLLRLQRDSVVAAYNDFQHRRGSLQSAVSVASNAFASPSSSLRRGPWAGSFQGALQMPWSQQPSLADGLGRALNASSRFVDSRKSSAGPVSRTSSSNSPQRQGQGGLEQPLHAEQSLLEMTPTAQQRQGNPAQVLSACGPQDSTEQAVSSPALQHDASTALSAASVPSSDLLSAVSSASGLTAWTLPDVQPDFSWLSPLLQQLVQFEACLLNSLTALLTPPPSAAHRPEGQSSEDRTARQKTPAREQCWPKAAQDSLQLSQDTTGMICRCCWPCFVAAP